MLVLVFVFIPFAEASDSGHVRFSDQTISDFELCIVEERRLPVLVFYISYFSFTKALTQGMLG